MSIGLFPWPNTNDEKSLTQAILEHPIKIPASIDETIKAILVRTLDRRPFMRASASQLLRGLSQLRELAPPHENTTTHVKKITSLTTRKAIMESVGKKKIGQHYSQTGINKIAKIVKPKSRFSGSRL